MTTSTQALEFPPDAKIAEGEEVAPDTEEAIYFPVCQRDPNDIQTILRLAIAAILFAMLGLALAGLLTYKLTRNPSLIVVERTQDGDRVVGDDQHYTLSGPVQVLIIAHQDRKG